MAAGDFRFKVDTIVLTPGRSVMVQCYYGVEPASGATNTEPTPLAQNYTWDEFLAFIDLGERAALVSIRDKIKADIKAKVAKLAGALDLA